MPDFIILALWFCCSFVCFIFVFECFFYIQFFSSNFSFDCTWSIHVVRLSIYWYIYIYIYTAVVTCTLTYLLIFWGNKTCLNQNIYVQQNHKARMMKSGIRNDKIYFLIYAWQKICVCTYRGIDITYLRFPFNNANTEHNCIQNANLHFLIS